MKTFFKSDASNNSYFYTSNVFKIEVLLFFTNQIYLIMRKTLLLAAMLIATGIAFAQTPLTVAVNFSGTTTEGASFDLFETLAGGQYVCIDFFYTT